MPACVFCQIIRGESPAAVVYRDDQVTAFRDIRPAGPTHILIIPNRHIPSVNDLTTEDEALVGHLHTVAAELAAEAGIQNSGYRLILNTGPDANQTVHHIHLHLIGGQPMRYPMG